MGSSRFLTAALVFLLVGNWARGQQGQAAAENQTAGAAVAATVNTQPIYEIAVQRGLKNVPPERQAEARPEILKILIDNTLIDQYLVGAKYTVEQNEIDAKLKEVQDTIKKDGGDVAKLMKEWMLSEAELRTQIAAQLRWDKFLAKHATDQVLKEMFDKNRDMFDNTKVHARHILLTLPAGDADAQQQAKAKLLGFKKQIEAEVESGLAKLPPSTDNLARERERARLIDEAFKAVASKESACPSKAQGGDLGSFPRVYSMVEPFASAAFALKPYTMSDVVTTQFGYHLILALERQPGMDIKFETAKEFVKEVYADRVRESMVNQLRPRSKIVISPPAK